MTPEQSQECRRLAGEFRDAEKKLARSRSKLIEADKAVQLAQGRLTEAQNLLEHIIDQIVANAQSGVGCAIDLARRTGDKRDCIDVAIKLSGLRVARQRKVDEQRRDLEDAKLARQAAQDKVDFARNDLDRLRSAVERGGCLSFLQ
ncbi:MAG: hypothetical protein AAGC70_13680 [Pseudomonadota bacterium]